MRFYRIGLLLAGLVLSMTPGCLSGDRQDESPLQVVISYAEDGKGDRSFNDAAYEGLVRAGLAYEFEKTEISPGAEERAGDLLAEVLAEPAETPELLIAVGSSYSALLAEHDCDYGGRFVLLLDDDPFDCPNLRRVTYNTFQPSFLAGIAAMQVAKRRTAAFIGGMPLGPVDEFGHGFRAGVEHAGGRLVRWEYVSDDVDGFADREKAAKMASKIFRDADIIFAVAGGSNLGIFEAAKRETDRYAVGVDSDQSIYGRGVVIGSVVKRLQQSVETAIADVARGEFEGGSRRVGLDENATDYLINPVFAEETRAAVEAARAAAESADVGLR